MAPKGREKQREPETEINLHQRIRLINRLLPHNLVFTRPRQKLRSLWSIECRYVWVLGCSDLSTTLTFLYLKYNDLIESEMRLDSLF